MAFISGDIKIDTDRLLVFKGRDIVVSSVSSCLGCGYSDRFFDTVSGTYVIELASDASLPEECAVMPLRHYFVSHSEAESALAARMKAYSNWRSGMKFCPSCGAALTDHPVENARVCPSCGKIHFPRIEPCIIAVIQKGDEILLLRHKARNQEIFSCLAGFVEAGETIEQTLVREVREETGLEICNIRYVGSQSWPFPDQLMLAFYADYKSGEIKVQESEILEARWFKRDGLPPHPGPGSISWRLIHFDF